MSNDRSLSELASDVTKQAGELIRNELRLARAEAMENVRAMGGGIMRGAIGVVLACSSVTLALFGFAYLLALAMPLWVAAFIMSIIGGVCAMVAVRSARKALSAENMSLPKTSRQISRDLNLIKETIT